MILKELTTSLIAFFPPGLPQGIVHSHVVSCITQVCAGAKCSTLPSESPLAKAEQGQRSKTFTSWNQNDLFAHDLVGAFDFRKGKQKKPEAKCLLRFGFHWKNKRVKSASATGRSHSRHRHTLSPTLLFPSCLQNTHPYSAYKTQNRYRGL